MASPKILSFGFIKIEDSPEQESMTSPDPPALSMTSPTMTHDPKDPENFQKRCSGYNKKTRLRCNHSFGKRALQHSHPTFLPTCTSHRDQQSFAGWCQFNQPDGERCGRLFRWAPPYFELCDEHQGHPDTPCHFLKLPLELRHEIYSYLLPTRPIGSSTAILHSAQEEWADYQEESFGKRFEVGGHVRSTTVTHSPIMCCSGRPGVRMGRPFPRPPIGEIPTLSLESRSWFPSRLMDLLLVSQQISHEVKDLLFRTTTFKIDVRGDGTFMCGRRLLEPRRPDGSSHFIPDDVDSVKEKFLKTFDWAAVRNYNVDILLEGAPHPISRHDTWDEEVEIYDIRDYVSVVVSGILAKCRSLCKLSVRVCFDGCNWDEDQVLTNTKLLVNPFERLRNIRQASLVGVYSSKGRHDPRMTRQSEVLCVQRPESRTSRDTPKIALCSVPKLPDNAPVLVPGMPSFDTYRTGWAQSISLHGTASLVQKPPIRKMFTEFKDFYSNLAGIVPDVSVRTGRHAFLHRARVAREQEDVESFRHLRNELIQYWQVYLENEERKKNDINMRLSRMLDTDIYPSHERDEEILSRRSSAHEDVLSPILNTDSMTKEGIPMTANRPSEGSRDSSWYRMQQLLRRTQTEQSPHVKGQLQQQLRAIMQAQQQAQQYYQQMRMRAQQTALPQTQAQQARRLAQQSRMACLPTARNQALPQGNQMRPQNTHSYYTNDSQPQEPWGVHMIPPALPATRQQEQLPPASASCVLKRSLPQQVPGTTRETIPDPLSQVQGAQSVISASPPSNDDVPVSFDLGFGPSFSVDADLSGPMMGEGQSRPQEDFVDDQPGPSVKRRRTDSGYQSIGLQEDPAFETTMHEVIEIRAEEYSGKGKGKAKAKVVEVVCID